MKYCFLVNVIMKFSVLAISNIHLVMVSHRLSF